MDTRARDELAEGVEIAQDEGPFRAEIAGENDLAFGAASSTKSLMLVEPSMCPASAKQARIPGATGTGSS